MRQAAAWKTVYQPERARGVPCQALRRRPLAPDSVPQSLRISFDIACCLLPSRTLSFRSAVEHLITIYHGQLTVINTRVSLRAVHCVASEGVAIQQSTN